MFIYWFLFSSIYLQGSNPCKFSTGVTKTPDKIYCSLLSYFAFSYFLFCFFCFIGIVFVFLNDKRYHNLSIFLAGLISLILLIFRFIAPFYAQRVANRGVSSELDYFKNTLSESVKIHFEAGFYITLLFAIILTFLNWRWSHSESISILEKRYIASEPVKKSIAGDYIFCSECGTRNHKNNSFCSNCGKKLS